MDERHRVRTVCTVPENRPRIYVGESGAVWHAIYEASGGQRLEVVDGREADRVREAFGASLFAERKHVLVEHAEAVGAEVFAGLGEEVVCYGSIVGGVKPTKTTRALEKVAEVIMCDQKWAERSVLECFKRRGVHLEGGARVLILTHCSTDLSRARSVAEIARMAGVAKLTESSARKLLGSQKKEMKIWEVCDNLFTGKIAEAMGVAREIEPVVLAANMAENLRVLAAAREAGGGEVLVEKLGVHPYVAKKRVETARRIPAEQIEAALYVATEAEILVRRREESGSGAVARVHAALWPERVGE